MKLRALALLGILSVFGTTASAEVRMVVKDGRRFIYNDGPANIGASDEWLAAQVERTSTYDRLIDAAALENDVDPRLVKSVMLVESGFNPNAVSKKGARGLMQLMPQTAVEVGVRDPHDPAQNIAGGVRYLSQLLLNYRGDLTKSLAAYNAGAAAVDRYDGVPPYDETQLYVRKTLAAYRGKSVLGGGFGKSPEQTYRGTPARKGKPVQWTRDERTNRITLTTKSKTAARRLG
ncbi:MAG TPA: lytic transglycosylase domain-containing protein [Thermoanaerobaculia bacterium]|jgi:soluble lytic murein transglycosylase-like protein